MHMKAGSPAMPKTDTVTAVDGLDLSRMIWVAGRIIDRREQVLQLAFRPLRGLRRSSNEKTALSYITPK